MIATVIITTHNRPDFLSKCLACLINQSVSANLYEIIVVDSYSDLKKENKNIVSLVKKNKKINIRYFYNNIIGGITKSKNIAVNMSRTNNIIVADDDSLPSYHYIEEAIKSLNKSDLVIGRMTPLYEKKPRAEFLEKIITRNNFGYYITDFSVIDLGKREIEIPWQLAFASNCAFKKSFYLDAGGIGPDGFSHPYFYWNGSGEHNYSIKAKKIIYSPKMHAKHFISKVRLTENFLNSRSFYYGVGESFDLIRNRKFPILSLNFFFRTTKFLFRILVTVVNKDKFSLMRLSSHLKGFVMHQYFSLIFPNLRDYCRKENWLVFNFSEIVRIGKKNINSQWRLLDELETDIKK